MSVALVLASALAAPLDLNRASVQQLDDLPSIGRGRAVAIVLHRERFGPLPSVEALLDITGFGPGTLRALRGSVRVGPEVLAATLPEAPARRRLPRVPSAEHFDPNTATVAQLAAFPGVGTHRAERIVATRERTGAFLTCAELSRVPDFGPATVAVLQPHCRIADPVR